MAFDRAARVPHPARFRRARFPLSSWPARTRIQTADPAGRRRGHYREENEQRFHWNRSGVRLRAAGQTVLAVTGVITNNSVEATVRMAGNLGFDTYLVE